MSAALAALAISDFAEGYSQYQYYRGQAGIARSQANFKAVQSEMNARMLEMMGEEAINLGNQQARDYSKRIKKFRGTQRSVLASQGIEVDSGTAADLQQEAVDIGIEDVQTIRNNAWRQAFGYRQQSVEAQFNADFARLEGQIAEAGLNTQARFSLLGGAVKGASRLAPKTASLKTPTQDTRLVPRSGGTLLTASRPQGVRSA